MVPVITHKSLQRSSANERRRPVPSPILYMHEFGTLNQNNFVRKRKTNCEGIYQYQEI